MKKLLLLFLGIHFCIGLQGQETLTFKFANPSIYYESTINYLKFDVMLKASGGSSYLFASQINCNFTVSNYNTASIPTFELASGFEQSYDPPGPTLSAPKYAVTANWLSDKLNIAINHTPSLDSYYPDAYTNVPGTYVKFGTVYLELKSVGVNGMAGINFLTTGYMDGQQKYATGVSPWSEYYTNPNIYEGTDFTELYHGRIYSSGSGWTQFGGTMDWNTARNTSVWDTSAAAATITGTTPGSECKATSLRIHSGARLKIDSDHPLTVSSATYIANERGLWITSTASGTGSYKDNGTITYTNGGSVNVERYLTADKWHYNCIPVASTLTNPLVGLYVTRYDEPTHHFKYIISLDSTLNTRMLGYGIWPNTNNATVNFSGSSNTGSISIPTSRTYNGSTSDYDGWNLVGNPYPSAVDLSLATASWTNVEATAWFWNAPGGNYLVYPSGGAGTHTKYAPVMQGFFVHCNDAAATPSTPGSGTVSLTNAARVHNTETFLKEDENIPNLLVMTANSSINNYSDILNVYFDPDRTLSYESGFDALKFPGLNEAPQIYTLNSNEKLTVNALPFYTQNIIIPLGFAVGVDGEFALTAGNIDSFDESISIQLEDLKLQQIQNLRTHPVYNLSFHTGDDPNRFLLHFGDPYLGSKESSNTNQVNIYSYENAVYVNISGSNPVSGTFVICDLLGRKVYQNRLQEQPVSKFETGLKTGYYVVTVVTSDGTYNAKLYLQ